LLFGKGEGFGGGLEFVVGLMELKKEEDEGRRLWWLWLGWR